MDAKSRIGGGTVPLIGGNGARCGATHALKVSVVSQPAFNQFGVGDWIAVDAQNHIVISVDARFAESHPLRVICIDRA